ncbi:MAG TPA: diacylglycerol kinase family protein, partial [Sphingobium sp.]|nr:diacylglycerol kinase family protein [Sphingobium sp.]
MGARIRLILNGKAAQDAQVREAVQAIREEGHQVEVRVTWEEGDAERLVAEAADDAARGALDHLVAGGGDGTVNQVFAAAFETGLPERCTLGLLPLGTANDFAQSAGVPAADPLAALRLVLERPARRIDLGLLDGRAFV